MKVLFITFLAFLDMEKNWDRKNIASKEFCCLDTRYNI